MVEGLAPFPNRSDDRVHVAEHVGGSNAQDIDSSTAEPAVADCVTCRCVAAIVRLAVNFDCKPHRVAIEVERIGTRWMLAPEFETTGTLLEVPPKEHLGK